MRGLKIIPTPRSLNIKDMKKIIILAITALMAQSIMGQTELPTTATPPQHANQSAFMQTISSYGVQKDQKVWARVDSTTGKIINVKLVGGFIFVEGEYNKSGFGGAIGGGYHFKGVSVQGEIGVREIDVDNVSFLTHYIGLGAELAPMDWINPRSRVEFGVYAGIDFVNIKYKRDVTVSDVINGEPVEVALTHSYKGNPISPYAGAMIGFKLHPNWTLYAKGGWHMKQVFRDPGPNIIIHTGEIKVGVRWNIGRHSAKDTGQKFHWNKYHKVKPVTTSSSK